MTKIQIMDQRNKKCKIVILSKQKNPNPTMHTGKLYEVQVKSRFESVSLLLHASNF